MLHLHHDGQAVGPLRRSFAPWNDPSAVPLIRFEGVSRRFRETVAVNDLTLDIYEREFFALLGPSGCGKTTLLRMLAGFEQPDSGRILLDGQDMAGVPPYQRPVNMMFQSYALFPHMSVEENIAFGLVQDGLPRGQIEMRVNEMLRLVKLEGMQRRRPDQLSGGQKQRVALARALAKRPRVLLLDEPLGALDKKLREETQFELTDLQHDLGLTFIIVTHDQEEAMTMADRIAVMHDGKMAQVAPPATVYEQPASRYVADFIGDVNIIPGDVLNGELRSSWSVQPLRLADSLDAYDGKAWLALRPEKMNISREAPPPNVNALVGEVWDIGYLGDLSVYRVKLDNGEIVKVSIANRTRLIERPITWDDKVWLTWTPDAGVLLRG